VRRFRALFVQKTEGLQFGEECAMPQGFLQRARNINERAILCNAIPNNRSYTF
jgi:hypothetical protein